MPQIHLQELNIHAKTIEQLYQWRASTLVNEFSFGKAPLSVSDFKKDFKSKYHAIQKLPPLAIFDHQEWVGVIYFEPWFREDECLLSIYLNPEKVGQNIGLKAIELAIESLLNRGIETIIAFVKPINDRALKVFQKVGFVLKNTVKLWKHGCEHKAQKLVFSVKESRKTFVIAEAGSNCILGSESATLKLAKLMIEKAYAAGADAVKFQLFEEIYVPNAGVANYLEEDINDIFKAFALPKTLISTLADYAQLVGIEWMCSFFSEKDFECVDPFVQRHKIASYEIRHIRLLEKAAESQKPLLLSTGAATIEDIQWAINVFEEKSQASLTLLQCTAQYPAKSDGLNLRCIPTLRETFQKQIGLSDHSAHPIYAPVAAVTLGATVIEKHVTIHQDLPGPDHSFAIDFKSLKEMCTAIDETEKILGLAKKAIFPQEEDLAAFARRGLQAIRTIRKGDTFCEGENLQILRPGMQRLGIHPKYINEVEGKKAAQDIPLGAGLQVEDIIW